MAFINSWFLWALLALSIPIIIHLFHFRRYKKVLFTNVRFLKELKEEQNARRKLRNLLVLASRLLALAFLVFGFAQPFLTQDKKIDLSNKNIGVFIDNSFSMAALSKDIPLLDKAKAEAREIVNTYSDQDLFQILTHDFEGKHQRLLSKEDALSMIDEVNISPNARALSKALNRHQQILKKNGRRATVYLISDFQKSINDLPSYIDTSMNIDLIHLHSVQEQNISIDSAWLDAKVPMINVNNQMVVKISNHGTEKVENVKLSLIQSGQSKPVGTLNIDAKSSIIDTVDLVINNPGWQNLELKVSDYPISFDDSYYMSFEVSQEIKVLSINNQNANRYLNSVFEGLPYHSLVNVGINRIDYAQFADQSLIILNDITNISSGLANELENYILSGGNVLCFMSKDIDTKSFDGFFNRLAADKIIQFDPQEKEVGSLNENEFVFKDVFELAKKNRKLPKVNASFKLSSYQNRNRDILISNRDGSPYLLKYSRQKGHLYLCTSPLDTKYNDLAINAEIFVPMLYKMSISSQTTENMARIIGKDDIVNITSNKENQDLTYKIKGAEEFIPGQRRHNNEVILDINNQIKKSGFYDVSIGDKTVENLAYNYDRIESNLQTSSSEELTFDNPKITLLNTNNDTNLAQIINENDKGVPLWRWCLILSLIFLAIETLLLRFWKA